MKRKAKTATCDLLRTSARRFRAEAVLRFKVIVAFACVAVVLATTAAWGRDQAHKTKSQHEHEYAVMIGTVYGKDQRPLYGAKIKIRRLDQKKAKYQLISDHHGEFAQRVPPGPADYVLWIDRGKSSEQAATQAAAGPAQTAEHGPVRGTSAVRVHIEKDERVDIGLHPEQ